MQSNFTDMEAGSCESGTMSNKTSKKRRRL